MSKLIVALLLVAAIVPPVAQASGKDLDVPISRCYKEAFRVGTGIPVGSKADIAANRNLVYATDLIVNGRGDPRKNTAVALGYVLHVANGSVYFEPADALTSAKIVLASTLLRHWGIKGAANVARAGSHAFIKIPSPRLNPLKGVRIMHCVGLGERT